MNLYAYLRVGPKGRIHIPAEFHEHIGLPEGPAFIAAKLCVDGFIELGPVIPAANPPRVSEVLPGSVMEEPVDEPLRAEELADWPADRDLISHKIRKPWRDVAPRQEEDRERFPGLRPMPAGWRVEAVGERIHFEVPASAADGEFELTYAEALRAGIALIEASERSRLFRVVMEEQEDEEAYRLTSALEVMRSLTEQRRSSVPAARAREQYAGAPDGGNEAVSDEVVGDADDDDE